MADVVNPELICEVGAKAKALLRTKTRIAMTRVLGAAIGALLLAALPAFGQAPQRPDTVTMTGKPKAGPVTWDRIAGSWKLFKGKLQKQWGKLTHDDIAAANGRREELVGRIQARYGIDKVQADAQVDAWLKTQQ